MSCAPSTTRACPIRTARVDPWRDIERLELEFTLADLAVVEKRVERLRATGHHGTPAEREANDRELAVLERIVPALSAGEPIRGLDLDAEASRSASAASAS